MLAIELVRVILEITGVVLVYLGIMFTVMDCVTKEETPLTNRFFLLSIIAFLVLFNI